MIPSLTEEQMNAVEQAAFDILERIGLLMPLRDEPVVGPEVQKKLAEIEERFAAKL